MKDYLSYLKNYKWTYWILILISLIVSVGVVKARFDIDRSNKTVELIMSYKAIRQISRQHGYPMKKLLPVLLRSGLTTIALEEMTIDDLVYQGKVTLMNGYEIINSNRLSKNYSNVMSYLTRRVVVNPDYQYLIIDESKYYDIVKKYIVMEFGADRLKELGWHILEVKSTRDDLIALTLGFDKSTINSIASYDYKVIPRLYNSYRLDTEKIGMKMNDIANLGVDVKKVIFEGDSILGYRNDLEVTMQKLKKFNINFGYIEFANQKGAAYLSQQIPENTIKVHSIPDKEMEIYTVKRAIKRFFRAVHERNIKLLYVNPFINAEKGFDIIGFNTKYIYELSEMLKKNGYTIGEVSQIDCSKSQPLSILNKFLLLVGFLSIFMLVLDKVIFLQWYKHYIYSSFGLSAVLILSMTNLNINAVMALLCSLLFPVYAIISQFPGNQYREAYPILRIARKLACIYLISIVGAMFVVAWLSLPVYLLGLKSFLGVKIAFLVPIILSGLYYFIQPHRFKSFIYVVKRTVVRPITNGYLFIFLGILVLMAFYITRSGNNFVIPMTSIERAFREMLESLLYARPRTKEIFLAYPLLIFSLYGFGRYLKYSKIWLFASVGTIAPISVINTFAHIHSPILISFYRSIIGFVIGTIFGFVLIAAFIAVQKLIDVIERK